MSKHYIILFPHQTKPNLYSSVNSDKQGIKLSHIKYK